jgi:hypothetical protein
MTLSLGIFLSPFSSPFFFICPENEKVGANSNYHFKHSRQHCEIFSRDLAIIHACTNNLTHFLAELQTGKAMMKERRALRRSVTILIAYKYRPSFVRDKDNSSLYNVY